MRTKEIEVPDWGSREKGEIIRKDAALFYWSCNEKLIEALPETINYLYRQTELNRKYLWKRYAENEKLYDDIESMLKLLYNEQYDMAQLLITKIEQQLMETAEPKSEFYKYK